MSEKKPQNDEIASLYASLGIGKRKVRPSLAAKRSEIRQGQVAVLENVLNDIRRRARETPAWSQAYNSAATAVELELAAARKGDREDLVAPKRATPVQQADTQSQQADKPVEGAL